MSDFHISRDLLDGIPAAVDVKMEEVGLRSTLERLLVILNSDHAQKIEDQEFLHDLLNWIIRRLSEANEPLPMQVFNNLNSYLSNVHNWVDNQDWQNSRNMVPDILRELSILPTEPPQYSMDSARRLNQSMKNARQQLKASDTRLSTATGEFQQELEDVIQQKSAEVSERLESVLGAANRSARETTDEIDALKATANEYLEEIREANRLSADAEVGGGHKDAEAKERDRADLWRRIAVGAWVLAAAVAAILIIPQIRSDPTGWEQWALRMPLGLSIVGLVAAIGKYASRQSQGHRSSEWHLRNRALALRQIRLAVHDLSGETNVSQAAQDLLQQVGPVLYSDHQAPPSERDTGQKGRPETTEIDRFPQRIILASVLSSNVIALAIAVLVLVL